MLNPAARKAQADFSVNQIAKEHTLLAGQELKMTYNNGEYQITMPGQSYAIYKLILQ